MSNFKKVVKRAESSRVQKGNSRAARPNSLISENRNAGIKDGSLAVLEELVQCGICLEKMKEPRMLTCQHTFCKSCLKNLVTAKNLVLKSGPSSKVTLSSELKNAKCPVCQTEIVLRNGLESLEELPKNFHIETLLKLLEGDPTVPTPVVKAPADYRCVKCQTICEEQAHVCQHCMQVYCSICWIDHMAELDSNLSLLIKQVEESRDRLNHKAQNFSGRCDQLEETIKKSIEKKIQKIKKMEHDVLLDVTSIKEQNSVVKDMINNRIDLVKEKVEGIINDNKHSKNKISNYMNIHRETAKLFEEIYQFGEARIMYDADRIRIDQVKEGVYNDVHDEQVKSEKVENPFENVASMVKHYKSRSFKARLVWKKCPRPGGVGIPPWDNNKIYVAATDTHNILILDRSKFKLLGRINNPEMLCPMNLAFSRKYDEIYVTDKWKHCVHVFSNDGVYMKNFSELRLKGPDGIAIGQNEEVIVCDTGNNRVIAINIETGDILYTLGQGELHIPTSVAIHGEKIIVADTGNNRIKIFNKDGLLLNEIGAFGKNKGEFRSAEVVAVDSLGFILVGDAGNARIQVFQPGGKLVKIFGSKEGFAWISGIHITQQLDIICTDNKNRCLTIF
ncbi:RING finger protein nhl-1-like isoform X5 [Diabrotica virgifera virgifera]|uniref:RING-type domain-containing protein n=1 Tax=Diabrotica virgifera virgifera TaxID=50390 RepID=A0ABM5K2H9_DIAVI|nr:RING finger protein nhl-1-like isoform X5 [Diabrotica virgifera virgifera]